jgi:hypothetical protein
VSADVKRGWVFGGTFGAQTLISFVALHFSRHEIASLVFAFLAGSSAMSVVWVFLMTRYGWRTQQKGAGTK